MNLKSELNNHIFLSCACLFQWTTASFDSPPEGNAYRKTTTTYFVLYCNVLALLSYYALPSGGNRKTRWSFRICLRNINFYDSYPKVFPSKNSSSSFKRLKFLLNDFLGCLKPVIL